MTDHLKDFFKFLEASPTPWHATEEIIGRLKKNKFEELKENTTWKIKAEGKYFIQRGGAITAFIMPKEHPTSLTLGAAHTDSPCLKIKPHAQFRDHNMNLFRVEAYGGPTLSTWYDRNLAIAGLVIAEDQKGSVKEHLVYAKDTPLIIPSLAIHLSERTDGKPKAYLDKQEHLCPLVGLSSKETKVLETTLKKHISFKKIYSHDLFLVPIEPPSYVGQNLELIASYRLDNLSSTHAVLTGLLSNLSPTTKTLKMATFWNHEEVGSKTSEGAASPFFEDCLKRICISSKMTEEAFYKLKSNSICLSLDVSHCYHPNFKSRYDQQDHPLFESGPIIKLSSNMRYASDAKTSSFIAKICSDHKIPYQMSSSHSEIACGSTIGPVFSSATGIATVDLGTPLLAMHSTRELISAKDHLHSIQLLTRVFTKAFKG